MDKLVRRRLGERDLEKLRCFRDALIIELRAGRIGVQFPLRDPTTPVVRNAMHTCSPSLRVLSMILKLLTLEM